jgi:quercetin dioxygenase-like cupin family protein
VADRYEDSRGVIQDIFEGRLDAVTRIYTRPGMIRGNHVHMRTTQWTYVLDGTMTFAWTEDDGVHTRTAGPGELITEPAGVPHAWRSETETVVLVLTRGPRSGQAYEEDTQRLPENARLLT